MLTPEEILLANEQKPDGFKFDPRTKEGKKYLRLRERSVADLKASLGDLIDPDVFYTKHALIRAAAAL